MRFPKVSCCKLLHVRARPAIGMLQNLAVASYKHGGIMGYSTSSFFGGKVVMVAVWHGGSYKAYTEAHHCSKLAV